MIPFVRAELALKLEGLFREKAKNNQGTRMDLTSVRNLTNVESNNIDESDTFEEQTPSGKPINNYERAEEALKSEETFCKKSLENKLPDKKITEIKPIDTKRELAKNAGVSPNTIERVKKIQEKASEELKQKVSSSEISINQAYTTIKREENEQKHVRLT